MNVGQLKEQLTDLDDSIRIAVDVRDTNGKIKQFDFIIEEVKGLEDEDGDYCRIIVSPDAI